MNSQLKLRIDFLFLPSVTLVPAILFPKGAIGTILVFVVELSLVTWNERFN